MPNPRRRASADIPNSAGDIGFLKLNLINRCPFFSNARALGILTTRTPLLDCRSYFKVSTGCPLTRISTS